ncbi:hypothetical protein KLP40_19375 [Hymenobacter sp. NST-14]|uniref:hypothetical protein n=1 Tax=Hymenobacter piscis TaxID=2839984 RepID=UPI001C0117DB|nr:hypothetical protein [Hymenobacter piscis]MBT9395337.1 hypothetical protein [Hymenobacter piscis]
MNIFTSPRKRLATRRSQQRLLVLATNTDRLFAFYAKAYAERPHYIMPQRALLQL